MTNKSDIPEENITRSVIKYIRSIPNGWAVKTHGGPFSSGEPDVDGCIGGRSIKLEVKKKGHDATPLQKSKLETWGKCGAITGVVTSVCDVKDILKEYGIVK